MNPVATTAVTLGSLAALVSGCGWHTAVGTLAAQDDPRLSRAGLVSRVEAACARRSRSIAALPRPRAKADRKPFFTAVAALERAEFEALAALRPPRRDEREFARLLAASAELASISERFVIALARDDAHARRRALADVERVSAAYDRAARKLKVACRQSA